MSDIRREQQALLTRAADLEAQRQVARRGDNVEHEQRLSEELRRLWQRFTEIEHA